MTKGLVCGLLALGLAASNIACATAPANDDWANASVIGALPFVTSESNISQATLEATDPDPPCRQVGDYATTDTLWYTYTTGANDEYLTLRIPNNAVIGLIGVYTGSPGAFSVVSGGCAAYSQFTGVTRIAGLRLAANTTYSIEVAATYPPGPATVLAFRVDAATEYHVTKAADTNDGVCDADCSLREAVAASNASPGAVIIAAGTYTLTIAGATEYNNATGDLDLTQGMGIYGAGMDQTILDANHLDRALNLDSNNYGYMAFAVGDLTIRNGSVTTALLTPHDKWGGGLAALGGYGADYVGLERIAVLDSYAGQVGGGIALLAPGTIRDSRIAGNVSNPDGGGGLYYGYSSQRALIISGSTFSGNSANGTGDGGGIFAQGTLQLVNSTVSGNHAAYFGGGIDSEGNGSLAMASSTVVFNSAFAANMYATGTGAGVHLGGNAANTIVNSIIAGNTTANPNDPPDCAIDSGNPGNSLTSAYNLVQYPNNCGFSGSGDVTATPAGVAPTLADNGGATPTHALDTGSAALDSGDPAGCADPAGRLLANDQRGSGFARVVGAACDKGALESPTTTPPGAPQMDPASDSGSSASDRITNVPIPAFSGSCTTGDQIQLQVDATDVAPSVACAAGAYAVAVSASIAEGAHAITATATRSTVTSLRSPPLSITIDTTAPTAGIDSHPPDPDTNPGPAFAFSANESGSTFECSLDNAPFGACASPDPLSVAPGAHSFAVRATDVAGNTTATPANFDWTVLQAQTISFDPLADATLEQSPLAISASASSGLDVSFSSLTPVTCSVSAGTVDLLDLGTCTIRASQAGDGSTYGAAADVDRSFTVRPPAPAAPSLDPASDSGSSAGDGITNADTPLFTGACTDGDSIQLSADLVDIGTPMICSGSAYAIATSIAEGAVAIRATATRSAVASAASGALSILVDRTAPLAPSITAPAGPVGPEFTIDGNAEENPGTITVTESATTLCTANGPFVAGAWSCAATVAAGGSHTLSATQTDLAGNSSAASAPFEVGVDLVFRSGFE